MNGQTTTANIAPIQHATIPLGRLISRYELGLVMIAGATDDTAEHPVQWVHGSDLSDPTPFLTPRTVLLTTGVQFPANLSETMGDSFVSKLQDAGVCALGFAIGVAHERIPPALIRASERLELPLFRVPYDTPFIAISQTAARLIDAELHARDTWSLDTQRAISGAALHRDGIDSALRELAARLGRWAAITDPRGRVVSVAPASAKGTAGAAWVREEAAALVSRGIRSSRSRQHGDDSVQFQTLGHGGRLRGVLIVEGERLIDHAEQTAVGLLATLATVHLDQSNALSDSDADLRGAILRLLFAGHVDEAQTVAGRAVPNLPGEPLRVFHLGSLDDAKRAFIEDLRSFSTGLNGSLLGALDDSLIMLVEPRHVTESIRFFESSAHIGGLSRRTDFAGLPDAYEQAKRAREITVADGSNRITEYEPSMSLGVLDLLNALPAATVQSRALLEPLLTHDQRHGDQLTASLRTWLTHHGQTSPAAAALGVHRHTLRTRIDTASRLLQRDLEDPDVRTDLWAALRLLG